MSPFLSEAQRKYMHKNHPDIAERWEKETPKKKLPKHVKKSGATPDPYKVRNTGGKRKSRKTTKAPSRKR